MSEYHNTYLQDLIATGEPIPKGNYNIDISKPLIIPSMARVDFSNSVLTPVITRDKSYCLLLISGRDIELSNLLILGTPGPFGIGVKIVEGFGVSLDNVTSDGMGDAVYISNSNYINLKNVHGDNQTRNGLSIVSGRKISIRYSSFENNGLCGICIEANANSLIESVTIQETVVSGNKNTGIQISCPEKNKNTSKVRAVDVVRCSALRSPCGIKLSNVSEVDILSTSVKNCYDYGVFSTLTNITKFKNCLMMDNSSFSFYEKRCSGSTYDGNTLMENRGIGIFSTLSNNCNIINNVVDEIRGGRTSAGISVSSQDNCEISNNTIRHCEGCGIIHNLSYIGVNILGDNVINERKL